MIKNKLELTPLKKSNSAPIALSTEEAEAIEKRRQTIMEEIARHHKRIKRSIAEDELAFKLLTTVDEY